jgi:prophage DNA circulation protein
MNPYLRDKLLQKLETVSDERGYQVLDYVEFLESKYAERQPVTGATAASNPLSRFADAVEEKLRAGRVSASTIAETMSLMNKAVGVLNGAAAAGKSVASDLMSATSRVVEAASSALPSSNEGTASGTTGATGQGATGASTSGGTPPPAGPTPTDGSTPK